MKKDRVIAFDFDGVFISNVDFHRRHIENFLDTKFSEKEFRAVHNGNVYKNDKLKGFDAEEYFQSIKNEFIELSIVEGMKKVVEEAQKMGQIFIVSSGSEDNIRAFFAENDMCQNECKIYGVETNPSKEEKFAQILDETGVSSDDVIFITDTLGDILEANALNIASIAVTWGFQRIETLEQGAPFGFAHRTEDIVTLTKAYFTN